MPPTCVKSATAKSTNVSAETAKHFSFQKVIAYTLSRVIFSITVCGFAPRTDFARGSVCVVILRRRRRRKKKATTTSGCVCVLVHARVMV
mmetsp:Transcript_877/g.2540  ORF Transcript_877/g.2540 Transcript_877/m.2540 type:complete len:90 (-) Transcript_877:115-384(-)